MTVISYLLNMGGTPEQTFNGNLERNLCYLKERKIHLTAEYIPNQSNQTAD